MSVKGIVAIMLLAAAMVPAAAYATEMVGVDGRTFAFIQGESITVMDVTSPHLPLAVASISGAGEDSEYSHLQVIPVGGLTYLAAVSVPDDSLHILDVSVPYRPAAISVLPSSDNGLGGSAVSDIGWAGVDGRVFALLATGDAVRIIDMTDPREPFSAGYIKDGEQLLFALEGARDIESFSTAQGTYLLVAGADAIQIVDFGDPAAPESESVIRQGQYGFGEVGELVDVDVVESGSGTYAVIAGQNGVLVADLTNPSAPVHVATVTLGQQGISGMDVLATSGATYALISDPDSVHVVDVGNIWNPETVSSTVVGNGFDDIVGFESDGRLWTLSVGDTLLALDITDPASPAPAYARDGGVPYAPMAVETAIIGGKLYALTASVATNTLQVVEITDPENPVLTSAVAGGQHGYGELYGPHDVAVTEMGGRTYAVIPNISSNTIVILDVTNPEKPDLVSVLRDVETLLAPASVAIFETGSSTHAAVASHYQRGVQLVDITDPRSPEPTLFMHDGQYGFEAISDPLYIETATIDGSVYLLVGSYYENAVQMVDVTDPLSPVPAAAIFDGEDGFRLGGPQDIRVAHIGEETFAVVATAHDNGLTIVDITDPYSPSQASLVTDNRDGFEHLAAVQHLDLLEKDGRTLILATSYFENSVELIDITDPHSPRPVSSAVVGMGGFDSLIGPTEVSAVSYGGGTYAVVADFFGNGIQVIDISGSSLLAPASSVSAGLESSMSLVGTDGVRSIAVSGRTYALSAVYSQDAVQVTDITDPRSPVPVYLMRDGQDGFVLDGPLGIETGVISGQPYALLAGLWSDSVQVVDMGNPAEPFPVSLIRDGRGGFENLSGVIEVELVHISGIPYAVVAAQSDEAVHVISLEDPSNPVPVAVIRDNQDGFEIVSLQGVEVVSTGDDILLVVFSYGENAVQIIDIRDPANPEAVSKVTGGEAGYDLLYAVTDVDSITADGRTLLVAASYQTDSVIVIDITDPANPVRLSSVQGGQGGHYLHGLESVQVAAIGDGVFAAAASGYDSVQMIDITDPANPVRAAPAGVGLDGYVIYGTTDVKIVQDGSNTYLLFQTLDENTTPIFDITDPYSAVPLSVIPPVHNLERLAPYGR